MVVEVRVVTISHEQKDHSHGNDCLYVEFILTAGSKTGVLVY